MEVGIPERRDQSPVAQVDLWMVRIYTWQLIAGENNFTPVFNQTGTDGIVFIAGNHRALVYSHCFSPKIQVVVNTVLFSYHELGIMVRGN